MDGNRHVLPILAGGGTRLSAHVGILQALQDLDLTFTHLVGVSGGSIVAALYATGKPVAELLSWYWKLNSHNFLASLSLP